jgi:hypothetical protein
LLRVTAYRLLDRMTKDQPKEERRRRFAILHDRYADK